MRASPRIPTAALLLAIAVMWAGAGPAANRPPSQIDQIRTGWRVFNEKQCILCHAVWGEGETMGPDLGRTHTEFMSAGQLAGVMWNHAPDMWSRMVARGIPIHRISEPEMESLFAFLYFIRFIDEPGNVLVGEELVLRKRCVSCHATKPGETKIGPNFRTLGAYANPIIWTQKMWNHAPTMYARMQAQQLPWPTFEGDEMVDLIAYVQSIADASDQRIYLEPGDHRRGRHVFEQRGCVNCHENNPGSGAPQLDTLGRRPKTISQMAGLMWNHAPAMVELAQSNGTAWSTISAQEMADLITYFFSIRFYRLTGDPVQGRAVFIERNCNICHSQTGIARNLRTGQEGISPIQMARFMWNHGLEMLEKMEEMRVPWPIFTGGEMVDLLAYLNTEDASAAGAGTGAEPSP